MSQFLSRRIAFAGALVALASLPALSQVTMVTDGTNSSSTCTAFTVAGGSVVLTPTGCLNLSTPVTPTRLVNIATRLPVQTGDNVLIGGFIIGGSLPKTVVVRARGPSLASSGITNPLADPTLQLFSGQTVIASNDDWGTAANAAAITSSGFAPSDAKESAILVTLNPGPYTAIVAGAGATTGVGIVEVFEVDRTDIPIVNISTRGQVGTANDVMIGGFVIQGTQPKTVVIRAIGPSLASAGVTGVLANPTLRLLSGATEIAANDDWSTASNAAAISNAGYAPGNPAESVIMVTLNPGAYTAIVSGLGGTTGVALVEVYGL